MANADKDKITEMSEDVADVSQVDDATSSEAAGTATDEGIVIVDVETLLAEKIPELKGSSKEAAGSGDADTGDTTHSAFADALEDALGNSFDDDRTPVDDEIDALDELLKETELDNASAILEQDKTGSSSAQANSMGDAMGNSSADDDPSVVFGVFPPSYSNMPGGDTAASQAGSSGRLAGHDLDDQDDGWEHRALIAAAGESDSSGKSSGSALKAGALGLLGGLAIVGGAATYAVKTDMISMNGAPGDSAVTTTAATTQTAAVKPAPAPAPVVVEDRIPATAGVDVTNASGLAREAIKLSLAPRDMGSRNNYYVRVAGIPPGAKLSTGLNVGGGMWLLRPSNLVDVTLKVPSYFSGNFEMYAQLLQEDGKTAINTATPFTVQVEAEKIAAAATSPQQSVERQADAVVDEITNADQPKLAQLKPPVDDLESAAVSVDRQAAAAAAPGSNKTAVTTPAENVAADTTVAADTNTGAANANTGTAEADNTAKVDKLASLPTGEVTDEFEEEGLGYIPEDLGSNPTGLQDSGIRPPARAARAPRRSLLKTSGNRDSNAAASPVRTARVVARPAATTPPRSPLQAFAFPGANRSGGTRPANAARIPAAARAPVARPQAAAPTPPVNRTNLAVAPAQTGPDQAEQLRLVRQGDRFYKLGDLASARLFYLRAYNAGSTMAAMSVGRTYDPVYFEKLGVRGFQPDPQKALEWYNKALSGGLGLARTKVADLNRWLGR